MGWEGDHPDQTMAMLNIRTTWNWPLTSPVLAMMIHVVNHPNKGDEGMMVTAKKLTPGMIVRLDEGGWDGLVRIEEVDEWVWDEYNGMEMSYCSYTILTNPNPDGSPNEMEKDWSIGMVNEMDLYEESEFEVVAG